jgi:hypothetical protein
VGATDPAARRPILGSGANALNKCCNAGVLKSGITLFQRLVEILMREDIRMLAIQIFRRLVLMPAGSQNGGTM